MKEETGFSDIKIKELEKSQVEIEGEITARKFVEAREKALKKMAAEISLPGFRKGRVPEPVIVSKIGESAILEEAAETAMTEEYPKILFAHKIEAIGRPEISITKIAKGNPLGFKIKTSVMPKFKLPDYKEISKKEMSKKSEPTEVSEKEIDEVVKELQKNKAHMDMHKKSGAAEHDHNHPEIAEKDLPPADDEFAKSIGTFRDLSDLKNKIKENVAREKEIKNKEKKRLEIADKLVKETKIDVPEILTASELEKMMARLKDDVAATGLVFENYLKEIKKTEEDIRKEWRPDAEKKAKFQLILNKIAVEEKIEIPEKDIDREVAAIMKQYSGADPARVKIYVETILLNEKVFEFLEGRR